MITMTGQEMMRAGVEMSRQGVDQRDAADREIAGLKRKLPRAASDGDRRSIETQITAANTAWTAADKLIADGNRLIAEAEGEDNAGG